MDAFRDTLGLGSSVITDRVSKGVRSMDVLVQNLTAGGLISLGIVLAERGAEGGNGAMAGSLLFVAGWAIFLANDASDYAWLGAMIPLIAIVGQMTFVQRMRLTPSARRAMAWQTTAVLVVFMAAWGMWVYMKGGTSYGWLGLGLLMAGMMSYFQDRRSSMRALMGRESKGPAMVPAAKVFNPALVVVTMGWMFLAVDQSL